MKRLASIIAIALALSVPQLSMAAVVGSKHDLSQGGGQVCVFCHTPHNANTDGGDAAPGPLWNRTIDNISAFIPYTSPSMSATCDATPSPSSLACLSCHGGVGGGAVSASMHTLRNLPKSGSTAPRCTGCHPGGNYPSQAWQVGPDLSNDHPISMTYPAGGTNPGFTSPPDPMKGWSDVRLYKGKVECATCHDPHDNTKTTFLRKSNSGSNLCFTCHNK